MRTGPARGFAALLAAMAAAGCAAAGAPTDEPAPVPSAADAEDDPVATSPATDATAVDALVGSTSRLECDRLRLTVPSRHGAILHRPLAGAPGPVDIRVGTFTLTVRDGRPDVLVGGEDLSLVAEGRVTILRDTGGGTFYREGPFDTVVMRNGAVLRR